MSKFFFLITFALISLTSSHLVEQSSCYQEKIRELEGAADNGSDTDTEINAKRSEIATVMAHFSCLNAEEKLQTIKMESYFKKNEEFKQDLVCYKNELKKLTPESTLVVDHQLDMECEKEVSKIIKQKYKKSVKNLYDALELTQCTLDDFTTEKDFVITSLEMIVIANSGIEDEKIQEENDKVVRSHEKFAENIFGCILRELKK